MFERTLDDSANKRIAMAEAFLAVDAILNIYINVTSGIVVYPQMIRKRVMEELPFIASENIMMDAVKKGKDRQVLHERIRRHSMEAGKNVKERGLPNNMIDLLCNDSEFGLSRSEIMSLLQPENYTGRSAEQVFEFVRDFIDPVISENKDHIAAEVELKV